MSIKIVTNYGFLKFELFCSQCPLTCKNFLALAASGYYNNTTFHKNISGFIIQGGDPTGTGKGGESIYGKYFEDEIDCNLKFDARGILAMAGKGISKRPNTNGSQFFITYSSLPQLNGEYVIFGRLIDGFETLNAIENIETDKSYRPISEVRIEDVIIHSNPIAENE
ncbi:cyclophilin-like protein [Cryptosporidium xiaoi]|uniref:Peptidyl-prolyl cis-trans isomerase n=1 Tax=Cryptosporidium xiaoi TaxID=659607 RepID=A0AAV9Y293_9CRYT